MHHSIKRMPVFQQTRPDTYRMVNANGNTCEISRPTNQGSFTVLSINGLALDFSEDYDVLCRRAFRGEKRVK